MKVANIIEGLQIIESMKPEKESDYHFRAEHDEIWVGSLEWVLSDEQRDRLEQLGWTPDEEADGWHTLI